MNIKPSTSEHDAMNELVLTLCIIKNRHVHFNMQSLHVTGVDCDGMVMRSGELCPPEIQHVEMSKVTRLERKIKREISLRFGIPMT